MRFDELRLLEPIVRAVADAGYAQCTPIQAEAIPVALAGRDVLGCARTGTGKTAAFSIPMLQRLAEGGRTRGDEHAGRDTRGPRGDDRPRGRGGRQPRNGRRPGPGAGHGRPARGLVLAPTRELATQIHESIGTYGRHLDLDATVIFGGVPQGRQVRDLRRGVDVIVATPGRLLDLIQQGHVDLGRVETLVLDEADHMLDMGFIRDIRRIVALTPPARQTLLFSATMPPEIRSLAEAILDDPASIAVTPPAAPAESVAQSVYHLPKPAKPRLLARLLGRGGMDRTLVFTRTKHGADRLVKLLGRAGLDAAAIHGNKTQGARQRALEGFRRGRTPVLVATDIAARGIDVDGVTHVVNFDVPSVPETYVHRIGRTARAGASGIAITLCTPEERADLAAIERLTRVRAEVMDDHVDLTGPVPAPLPERTRGGGDARSGRSSKNGRGGRGTRGTGRGRGGGRGRGRGNGGGDGPAAEARGGTRPTRRRAGAGGQSTEGTPDGRGSRRRRRGGAAPGGSGGSGRRGRHGQSGRAATGARR